MDEQLLRQAKQLGLATQRTLTAVIEDAVREEVARPRIKQRRRPILDLPTFRGGGTLPGVDLDNNSLMLDIMDGLMDGQVDPFDPSRR